MSFLEVTKQTFAFLEEEGFRLARCEPNFVQYETYTVEVAIWREVRSGEMDVNFRLISGGSQSDAVSLTDLLIAGGVTERTMPFQVYDETKIEPFVKRLAEETRTYAQPALKGDRIFYRRMDVFRASKRWTYTGDMNAQRVRKDAESAWQVCDLGKVQTLYSSIEDDLTVSEKAKLDYARRHLPK